MLVRNQPELVLHAYRPSVLTLQPPAKKKQLRRLKASPSSHIAMQAFMAATASNKSNIMAEKFKRLCCTSNRGIQKEKLMDRCYQDNAFSQAPE